MNNNEKDPGWDAFLVSQSNQQQDNTNTSVALLEDFKATILGAPETLFKNQTSVQKATEYGTALLQQIKSVEVMTPELDAQANEFLVKTKKTYAALQERRGPLTKALDQIRERFTSLEAKLDPKGKDNIYAKIQQERNNYAAYVIERNKKLEAERQLKLIREKEIIRIETESKQYFDSAVNEVLAAVSKRLNNVLNSCTLETYEIGFNFLKEFSTTQPAISADTVKLYSSSLTTDEMDQIKYRIFSDQANIADYKNKYFNLVADLKINLLDKMPSRKKELEEIEHQKREQARLEKEEAELKRKQQEEQDLQKKAELERQQKEASEKAAELERLRLQSEEQAKIRQRELEIKADEEKRQADAQAKINNDLQSAAKSTTSLFETAISATSDQAVNALESYELEFTSPAAWMQIINFWFQKEGLKTDPSEVMKMGSKKLESMKSFAEKHYKKTGEKIESELITYRPVYTVRNKAVKE